MKISEKVAVFEKENHSKEDLLTLFEYYIEERTKNYISNEDRENARISYLALKRMILNWMN